MLGEPLASIVSVYVNSRHSVVVVGRNAFTILTICGRSVSTLQRRVERSVVHQQHVFGGLLDRGGNAVPVLRPEDERPQDEEIERALEQLNAIRVGHRAETLPVL